MPETKAEIDNLKTKLGLQPHPTGKGAFKEVWRADRQVIFVNPTKHDGPRAAGTSIYFLLEAGKFVSWHKHHSEEAFYFHIGGPLKVHMIHNDGTHELQRLGDLTKESCFDCECQIVIPHDTWYSVELEDDAPYCLFSAVLMPGFEFQDWLEGNREDMIREFPQHTAIIERLTESNTENA